MHTKSSPEYKCMINDSEIYNELLNKNSMKHYSINILFVICINRKKPTFPLIIYSSINYALQLHYESHPFYNYLNMSTCVLIHPSIHPSSFLSLYPSIQLLIYSCSVLFISFSLLYFSLCKYSVAMTGHTRYKYLIIEVKTRTIVAIDFNSDTWNLYTADQIVNAPFCKGLNDIYRDGIYWVQYIFFV